MFSLLALLVDDPTDSVLVKLVLSLLQLCKLATNHPGGADILGIKSNNFSALSGLIIFSFTNTNVFLQRQQAAVWENWVLWISPPSPCFTAETPSMKRLCLSSPPPSLSVFTLSSTAWMRHSPNSGTVNPRSQYLLCTTLEERAVCVDVCGVLCCGRLPVLRWGRQPRSVWRTSSPLSLESTSGSNTKTTETPCWPTSIPLERPRRRCVCVQTLFFVWMCVFVFAVVMAVSAQLLPTVVPL